MSGFRFLPDIEISSTRSELTKNKVRKVEKNIMFSEVHNQRHKANDFFGDESHYSNQTDVSLTSASDLVTNVKSRGKLRKISSGYLLTGILDFIYNLFIYFIHILSYTL